jgi:hypothetical protein
MIGGEKMKKINPQNFSYAFCLGPLDCYKIKSGKCSLDLTNEDYESILEKEGQRSYLNGSVEYCRELAKHLVDTNSFTIDTGIRAFKSKCGHVAFGDGQHRTCIARRLNIQCLILEVFKENNEYVCRPCYFDEVKRKKSKIKIFLEGLKVSKMNNGPDEFIGDDKFFNRTI